MQYDNNNSIIVGGSPTSWMTYDDNSDASDTMKQTTVIVSKKHSSIEKSKRKQVKNACVNCQKACKKCDDGRPCKRCVKLGLTSTCRDSDRKERKKGVKRGPYKKRQAYIKDKPVYPKLTEENWTTPIYERVPQVLSHNSNQSIYTDFYEESYCVPSQSGSSLSPTSSSSFVDESDETLHYAYGYGYTNNNNTITTSPSATSMLDYQTISGNVTPIQDSSYSWDDIENYSPIGSNPIMMNQFPTTAIYQQKDITTNNFNDLTLLQQLPTNNNYWYNNDMPIEYQPQPQPQQHYFEYSIPPQYNTWSYSN